MVSVTRQFLLALFALLQCIAPLAHAHIDGADSDHAVHSHEISVHSLSVSSYTHMEQQELAAISIPQALTINKSLAPDQPPGIQAYDRFITIRNDVFFSLPEPTNLMIADPGYLLCLAQAPPRALTAIQIL